MSAHSELSVLAASAATLQLAEIPVGTVRHAELLFADTLGVIMGGAQQNEIRRLIASESARSEESQILAPGLPQTTCEAAAFINATAGTFLELDQGVRPTGHPAIHVIPAALAVAQSVHATGADLIGAIIAGCEVATRLFETYELRYPIHPHGHLAAIGAATAVARLRRRPAGPVAAVAATLQMLTVWEPCYEGATARNAWAGVAAEIGVKADRLFEAGFTGSERTLSIAFGEVVGKVRRTDALTGPIRPDDLHFTNDYLKLHSACALTHAALDAVLSMKPDPTETQSVLVETVSNNLKLDRQPTDNSLSTRFSLPYAVAAAIVHGHARPEAFAPNPLVFQLARRVVIQHAPDLEAAWPASAPARVTVRTGVGSRTVEVDNPRGHHANPASEAELRSKFETLSWASNPGDLFDRLLKVSAVGDCAYLLA